MLSQEIANIILQVVLIASYIGLFFFTIGSRIEQDVFKKQINYAVADMLGDVKIILSDKELAIIRDSFAKKKPADMSKQDKIVEDNNKKLLNRAIFILSILLTIGVILSFLMAKIFKFSFYELIGNSLIVLFFVALTEVLFILLIARNYKSLDPNFIKYTIINVLDKFSNK